MSKPLITLTSRNHNLTIIATIYSHPIEYIFNGVLSSLSGLFLMKSRLHAVTLSIWVLFKMINVFEEHCGYDFPCHLINIFPFTISSEFHDFHHLKNIGNYSGFSRFWDNLFGTDVAYTEFKKDKKNQLMLDKKKIN